MGFENTAYKTEGYREKRPEEPSPEVLSYSEKVAEKKIKKVEKPGFKEFSVRYVNIGEYRDMLETGKFGGYSPLREVIVCGDGTYHDDLTFRDILNRPDRLIDGTNWDQSQHSLTIAHILLNKMKSIQKNSQEGRAETLQMMQKELVSFMESKKTQRSFSTYAGISHDAFYDLNSNFVPESSGDIAGGISAFSQDELNEKYESKFRNTKAPWFLEGMKKYIEQEIESDEAYRELTENDKTKLKKYFLSRCLEDAFGKEVVTIVRSLKNDPAYLEKPGALRETLNVLTHLVDNPRGRDAGQYMIALILDNKTFQFKEPRMQGTSYKEDWGSFNRPWTEKQMNSLSEAEVKQGLLAAISIMPLKDLHQEMILLDKGASDLAHPIYDNNGVLRWPK